MWERQGTKEHQASLGPARALFLSERFNTPASTIASIANGVDNMNIESNDSPLSGVSPGLHLHPSSPSPDRIIAGAANPPRSASRRRSSSQRPVHSVEDEELPRAPFHDPAFQREFQGVQRLMAELAGALEDSPLHNEPGTAIATLHKRAQDLRAFQCHSTRTVGLVGDSGVGK
jgi:hypothetical protein